MHSRAIATCALSLLSLGITACGPVGAAFGTRVAEDERPLEVPPIKIEDHQTTFPVFGRTVDELRRSLSEYGPEVDSRRGSAATRWEITARGRCACFSNGCALAEATVMTKIETELPKWVPVDDPDPALQARWQRVLAALVKHEVGHRTIAIAEAEALRRELPTLGRQVSCEVVQDALSKAIERTTARQTERQRAYDEATQSGAKQGAVL